MIHEDIIQVAHEAIHAWSRTTDKLIAGIDGYPGVGKTYLATELARLNSNILVVCRDDFILERTAFKKILDKAEDRTLPFEFDMLDLARFRRFLETYKRSSEPCTNTGYNRVTGKLDVVTTYDFSKPILLVDGVFLFHDQLTNDLFDRRIFLKGDHDVIARRRVAREQARWGADYFPEDHPDSYFRLAMLAFDRYVATQHPENKADLVLNMTPS